MAQDQTRRLQPNIIQEDIAAFEAIQGITAYAPANADFALTALTATQSGMNTARTTEVQKQGDADAARDAACAAEWTFHNAILGAKAQVKAQFGEDSDEWQALGMVKKSERKRPATHSTTTTTTTP